MFCKRTHLEVCSHQSNGTSKQDLNVQMDALTVGEELLSQFVLLRAALEYVFEGERRVFCHTL